MAPGNKVKGSKEFYLNFKARFSQGQNLALTVSHVPYSFLTCAIFARERHAEWMAKKYQLNGFSDVNPPTNPSTELYYSLLYNSADRFVGELTTNKLTGLQVN